MNPWHDVSIGNPPNAVNAIIEIPQGSNLKYEVDKETGMLLLDRALYGAQYYPGNYGFIPQTYWEDQDPLDVIIISEQPIYPLTIAMIRPVGVMRMNDSGESDDKIIAVLSDDPRYEQVQDISDLPAHKIKEIKNFFETYKELQNKKVEVTEVLGVQKAQETITKGQELYKKFIQK